jgi:hypothetical protein
MEPDKLTITLTGQAPVRITKEDWPIIASAKDSLDDGGEVPDRANRTAKWHFLVRQHADRRAIVYAIYEFSSHYPGEREYEIRGGEMLPAGSDMATVVAALERLAANMESRMPAGVEWSTGYFPELLHKCVADLPAVEVN